MEKIFFSNLKSELKNIVLVDGQSQSFRNFTHIDENSAKYVEGLSIYPGFEISPTPVLKEIKD